MEHEWCRSSLIHWKNKTKEKERARIKNENHKQLGRDGCVSFELGGVSLALEIIYASARLLAMSP